MKNKTSQWISFVHFVILFSVIKLHVAAQAPGLHIEKNLEALRLDGNQAWLSFYDGPVYKGLPVEQ